MQYYVKIFNTTTNELVGYYKETGLSCITKLPKGMKYFNKLEDAMAKVMDIDDGFIRDKDGKYYVGHAVAFGENKREPTKSIYRSDYDVEEGDGESAIDAFIRQNRGRNR